MPLAALAAVVLAAASAPAPDPIIARTMAFLDAYASDDVDRVLAMTDPRRISLYGSDVAEFCEGADCVRRTMADDFALWKTARFGAPEQITVRREGRLASIVFNVPMSIGGRAELPIRMSLVWRREGGAWRLTQASNVVPTRGSSAADILRPPGSARPPAP